MLIGKKGIHRISYDGFPIAVERLLLIYTDIEVVYRVTGDVKPESIARAIALSETKYCGAAAMLGKSAQITTRYEIIHEPELVAA